MLPTHKVAWLLHALGSWLIKIRAQTTDPRLLSTRKSCNFATAECKDQNLCCTAVFKQATHKPWLYVCWSIRMHSLDTWTLWPWSTQVKLTCSDNCSKWHHEGLCITVCHSNRVSVERTPTARETIWWIWFEGQAKIFTLANQKENLSRSPHYVSHDRQFQIPRQFTELKLLQFTTVLFHHSEVSLIAVTSPPVAKQLKRAQTAQCELARTGELAHARHSAPQAKMTKSLTQDELKTWWSKDSNWSSFHCNSYLCKNFLPFCHNSIQGFAWQGQFLVRRPQTAWSSICTPVMFSDYITKHCWTWAKCHPHTARAPDTVQCLTSSWW